MALSDEERTQLAALQAKESEPDGDDFDIEIWDDTGAGAKVPYSKGKTWLQRFGIDIPAPAESEGDAGKEPGKGSKAKTEPAAGGAAQRYFKKPA